MRLILWKTCAGSDNADTVILSCDAVGHCSEKLCRAIGNAELDIEELRTFVEVADAGGVSPAARRLGVSKSLVSRQLARLAPVEAGQAHQLQGGLRLLEGPGARLEIMLKGPAPKSMRPENCSCPTVSFAVA